MINVILKIAAGGYKTPNVAVNDTIIYQNSGPFSQVSNGSNNPYLTAYNINYTIPTWWETKQYEFFGTITSNANLCCICYLSQVFVNGVNIMQSGSSRNSSNYFISNTGTINLIGNYGNDGSFTGSTTFNLKAGDVVNMTVLYVARNVSGTATASNITAGIRRIT